MMIPSLKEVYKDYFKIGTAVNYKSAETHKDLITRHFNSITCENEMKYGVVCTQPGVYDFTNADKIHKFALENDIGMRGHAFVWHRQTPDFIFACNNREELLDTLTKHMKLMAERFEKGFYAWDVVNEAIADNELFLRKTKWLEILGEDYIAEIFTLAANIFKNGDLYYNDYGEMGERKRGKIIKLIRDMINREIPVTGIGLQSHNTINSPDIDEIKRGIELYAELGLKLSITELDVSMYSHGNPSDLREPTAEMIEKQADYYAESFKIYREYSKHIDSITLWGIADDKTWLDNFPVRNRKNWPLLFDENHEPKEAFWRIAEF